MKPSKLLAIISTFSKKDWKEFKKWSRSVYEVGSTGARMVDCLTSIKNIEKYNSNKELQSVIKEKSELNINDRSLANALTQLTENIDLYLAIQTVVSNPLLKSSALLDNYAARGISTLFHDLKDEIDTHSTSIWDNYHRIHSEFLSYFKGFYPNYTESRSGLLRLITSILHFTKDISDFVMLELVNRSLILNEDWKDQIAALEVATETRTKFSNLFEQVFSMRKDESETAYRHLREEIINGHTLEPEIIEILMVHITSFLNRRFKKGEYKLAADILEFYTIGVRNGYYLTDGKMSNRRFLNIVNTACSLGKQDWAFQFTEDFAHLLQQNQRSNVEQLCRAAVHFANNDFGEASLILSTHKFNDFDIEYRARLLKLQSNVEIEKDNYSYIKDEIRSFHYYLKRNSTKMSEATRLGTKTLLKYLDRVLKNDLDEIEEDLNSEKYLMLGRWLRKSIREKRLKE